jgi:hypothetical protein
MKNLEVFDPAVVREMEAGAETLPSTREQWNDLPSRLAHV